MFLQGEEIFLRAVEPSDADILYLWENNPDHWRVSHTLLPFSKHLLLEYVNSAQDIFLSKQLRLIICLKQDDKPIGAVDLFDFEPFHQRAGLGILIAEKQFREKGYASEALDLTIDYCFEVLLLNQLFCNIEEENESSLNLFQGKGFDIIGLKKNWNRNSSGFSHEYMLQLLNYRDL
jgi:diamine N-acetyltransferase